MAKRSDQETIGTVHNTARYFVEHPQIAWAALLAVAAWGVFGYYSMPQRKDPEIPVRVAVAACQWPGATAQQVEQLITKPIEQAIAQNKTIHPPGPADWGIRSMSLPGASFVYVQLAENVKDTREQFSDINLKLQALNGRLPQGASPVQFQSDFGDTAALMLTVASPQADDVEINLRARSIEDAVRAARRAGGTRAAPPVSLVLSFPVGLSRAAVRRSAEDFSARAERAGILLQPRIIEGRGFIGIDAVSPAGDAAIRTFLDRYLTDRVQPGELDPDIWRPIVLRDPAEARSKLAGVAGAKYTYAELDDYTDLIARTLLGVPQASRVERKGLLPQTVYLNYSQERLASYGLQPADLGRLLAAQNITLPGGALQAGDREIRLDPSGRFETARAIGDVVVAASPAGAPVYLRDLVEISQSYRSPADYLNYYTWFDKDGSPHRSRAITIALYMRAGEQIRKFGAEVDAKMEQLRDLLPPGLIVARTSDQPLQVRENIDLFMQALYEAVLLVVIIALIGFWEWRSAFLMALSIPITLAMTFGFCHALGVDLQQVSIGAMIVALGLLVDDPVVANDAIKRELAAGQPPRHASWLGPTKLARAILYATATNIIAYLPFLLVEGVTGDFLRTLPIVMTAALVSSRIVSMTFIPLIAYYLLRPARKPERTLEERRRRGFYGFYYRASGLAIRHRWAVLAFSLVFLAAGALVSLTLRTQFFPEDVQYWSYVDVWLPNNAPVSLANDCAQRAEAIIQRVAREHPIESLTTFVGGGGPRFWFSVSPEQQQPNYAQVLIRVRDKEITPALVPPLQAALSREIPGAFVTLHQLQINPVEFPVEVRIASTADVNPDQEAADIQTLRRLAGEAQDILRPIPGVQVVQNDWFAESPEVRLRVDADRANLAGVTNRDVALSAAAAISGATVTTLRQGDQQIPVVARLFPQERAQLADVQNLYVYSSSGQQKIPLRSISKFENVLESQRIRRLEHFRTIGVHAWPQPGVLASEVMRVAAPKLDEMARRLPPGYRMEIGGERAKQQAGFRNLAKVLIISLVAIYAALLLQFNNAIKPLLVFAATPFGVVGALLALALMRAPFGFMAFLGVASLIGVIVSHIIVLFDFIEEMHERGEPFEQALRDAGIERLRPVLITVGATILALFPLARHGGPLWEPLCYAQIGGLAVATFITLGLVPVLYSIAVLDLKVIRWGGRPAQPDAL
ncbi:MAG: efflux RND transporter permease subunit [Acidobacteriota bacterium]